MRGPKSVVPPAQRDERTCSLQALLQTLASSLAIADELELHLCAAKIDEARLLALSAIDRSDSVDPRN